MAPYPVNLCLWVAEANVLLTAGEGMYHGLLFAELAVASRQIAICTVNWQQKSERLFHLQ